MQKNTQPNRCPNHLNTQIQFYCSLCKTFECWTCQRNHKSHKSKHFSLPEKLLANYEYIKFLGGGTYGTVFKVKSLTDDQEMALKIITEVDEDSIQKFKKEAQFLCSLEHKNIVKYIYSEWIKEEEMFFILMELIEGSLQEKIKTISQEDAFCYFKQISEGLCFLHEDRGIMHRDLKPGNILIKGDECKICDMGEAKQMKRESTFLTNDQQFGTELYLPHEVLEGKKYGFKADIWALGIMFYKMLTNGDHPFYDQKDNDMEVLKQRVKDHNFKMSPKITNQLHLDIVRGFYY